LGNVLQHLTRGQKAQLEVTVSESEVIVALDDEGAAFGPPEDVFSRDGQLAMKSRSDERYSRGLALYVIGLVVRAMRGTIETGPKQARGRLRVRLPRVRP
jgi:K+-sensing histidine kinase KdpD